MSGINFSQYPKVLELIKETNLENEKENIKWIGLNQEEAAVLLAEMHLMAKAGLSNNITLRKRSKNASNYYYSSTNRGLHVFAIEQARTELNLSDEDVKEIFSHKSLLGSDHPEPYVNIPL